MKLKRAFTIILFIALLITSIIFVKQPSYTGYVIQDNIAALQSLYNDTSTMEILSALNIDIPTIISSLNDYDLQVQTLQQDLMLNDTEKQAMEAGLEEQADSLIADVPQVLTVTKTISSLTSTPVENITPSMLIDSVDEIAMQQIYELQNNAESKMNIKVISMLTFSGGEITKTYIQKTVEAPISSGYIIEIIPDALLSMQDDFKSSSQFEVVGQSPFLIKFPVTGNLVSYSYLLPNDVSGLVDQIQFAVIPSEIVPVESVVASACGDGICTEFLEDEITCPKDCARKIPWLFITLILVLLIVGIIFINIYKHKLSGMNLKSIFKPFKKHQLFESEIDKQNIINYIKTSLSEKIEEPVIKKTLLSKGWNDKQIDFAFKEVSSKSL